MVTELVQLWAKTTRSLSLNGTVMVDIGGGIPQALRGVRVELYRFTRGGDGKMSFELLQQTPARTTVSGDFSFANAPVFVEEQQVVPGSPPYTPVVITNEQSLPNIAFRISVEAEVLTGSASDGNRFIDVFDETDELDDAWIAANPDRMNVPLTGSLFTIVIPEGHAVATELAGLGATPPAVPAGEVHLLRVGRCTREEIRDADAASSKRIGYMTSAPTTFYPDVLDAPFGGVLQIGGHFGPDFLTPPRASNLYYTLSWSEYGGAETSAFDPSNLTNTSQVLDPLFNKKYLLPTPALPYGEWQSLNLGPFSGVITAVQAPHDPALVGTTVRVYERPPLANLATEYWPFWDLLATWNSNAAPNRLVVLTIEMYERTGGTESSPELTKLAVNASVNDHLPLRIDNRPPVPVFLQYDPAALPGQKLSTAMANFIGVAAETVGPATPLGICNEIAVGAGDAAGNECILMKYSVEDGAGNPHPHVLGYWIAAEYTPKAVANAPDSRLVTLKPSFTTPDPAAPPSSPDHVSVYRNLSQWYPWAYSEEPLFEVNAFKSVLVPQNADGWPPEPAGDLPPGSATPDPTYQCRQYALEISLGADVRTIDGWSRLFSSHYASRHLIMRKN